MSLQCNACTFLNISAANACEICGQTLAQAPLGSWACGACTFLNTTASTKCELCHSVLARPDSFEGIRPKLTLVGRVNPLLTRPLAITRSSLSSSEEESSSSSSSISSESENEDNMEHPPEDTAPQAREVVGLTLPDDQLPFVVLDKDWNLVNLRSLGKALERDTCLRSLFLVGEHAPEEPGQPEAEERLIYSTLSRPGFRLSLSAGELLYLFANQLVPSEMAFVLPEVVGDYARITLGMALSRHKKLTALGIHGVRMGHTTSKFFGRALANNATLESLVVSNVDYAVGSYMKHYLHGALSCKSLQHCKLYFNSGTRSTALTKLLQKENLVTFSVRPFVPLVLDNISSCLLSCELIPVAGRAQATEIARHVNTLVEQNLVDAQRMKRDCAAHLGPSLAPIVMDFVYPAWPAMIQFSKAHDLHL